MNQNWRYIFPKKLLLRAYSTLKHSLSTTVLVAFHPEFQIKVPQMTIDGFHVTSSPPCWWTKTKDLSLASFVRPPEVVRFSIVIGVSRGWLKTSYTQ